MAQQQQSQKPTFFLLFFFLLVALHCISFLVLFFSCIFSFYLIVFSSYVNMVESISVVFPFSNRRLPLNDPSNNWNSTRGREEDKKRKRVGYTSINRRDDKREKTLGEYVVLLLIQFPRPNFSPLSFPSPHLIFFYFVRSFAPQENSPSELFSVFSHVLFVYGQMDGWQYGGRRTRVVYHFLLYI